MTKTCFVISPIGEEGSEIRKQADRVYESIIKRTCRELGYDVERADEIERPGFIHTQIVTKLLSVDLVIADLTNHNPNVFYELAVRHYSRKHVIHLIEKPQKIPFDVASNRAIPYSLKTPEDGFAFTDSLKNYILSTQEDKHPVQNPITEVLNIQKYELSEDPKDKSSAEILLSLQELRQDVRENLAEFNDSMEDLKEAMDALGQFAESGNRFSGQAIIELIRLAKVLNEYSVGGQLFTDRVNVEWVNTVKERLRAFLHLSDAPGVVIRAALNELDKSTRPQRPKLDDGEINRVIELQRAGLDIDEEFPPEDDLPF